MQAAFARTAAAIEPPASTEGSRTVNGGTLTGIRVCIQSDDDTLGPATDEGYNLTIAASGSSGSVLTASSIYGALHGLESLSQLVERSTHAILNVPVAIEDRPRFGYRGLLVDTGRHFLPLSFLKHVVDGLAANKLNVMHWHIVDFQSWPCNSSTFPALAGKGAYSPAAVFSPADMRELVAYAKARGVRVMPEWDVPGHSAIGYAFPELMACASGPNQIGVLDPTQDAVYSMLNQFFTEMMTIFTDDYVFLGGDEVNTKTCFEGNKRIAKWMKAHNMTEGDQVQQYFWQQMTARVLPSSLKGRTINIWEADNMQIDPKMLPKGTVANVYQSKKTADITIGKYEMPSTLSIASQQWYLDSQPPGYNWNSWEARYTVEPTSNLTRKPEYLPLLLGGEGAMWGEGINQNNFDAYVWHGMAAIGERLWSPAALTQSVTAAQGRLAQHVCRLEWAGFRPGPVMPGFCPPDAVVSQQ